MNVVGRSYSGGQGTHKHTLDVRVPKCISFATFIAAKQPSYDPKAPLALHLSSGSCLDRLTQFDGCAYNPSDKGNVQADYIDSC